MNRCPHRRPRWWPLSIVLALLVPAPAGAQAAGPAPALQALADGINQKVAAAIAAEAVAEPIVGLLVEGEPSILGQAERLTQELERLLVYRLQANLAVGRVVPLRKGGKSTQDLTFEPQAALLLRCVVGVDAQTIWITAELTPLKVPFWDRLVDPIPPGARDHLFVSCPVDEEIRLLLGKARVPPPLGNWRLEELLVLPERVLDLGVGDLDGQEGAELVVLTAQAVTVYALTGAGAQRLATRELGRLPEAPVRVRDPIGSLVVADFNLDGRHEIFYRLANRGVGEILTYDAGTLRSLRTFPGVPLCVLHENRRAQVVYGRPEPGLNRFLPEIEIADINQSTGRKITLPGPFVTLRCHQAAPDQPVWAGFVDGQGNLLRLLADWRPDPLASRVGAAAAVVDLDRDDTPDWVLSDPAWPGEPDSVRVLTRGEVVFQSRDVIGSVVAIAGGEVGNPGQARAFLAAVDPLERETRIYSLGR